MLRGKFERFASWMGSWGGWIVVLGILLAASALAVFLGGSEWRDAVEIREAKGRPVRAVDLAMKYGWWAAVINAALASVLTATLPWWSLPAGGFGSTTVGSKLSKGFWLVLAMAILMGWALRQPRMELSLYNDEAYSFRRQVSGEFKQRDGGPEFRRALWSETIWENEIANNPVLFSILARWSYEGWKVRAGGADGEVNEYWYRFPSLIAGLLGIGAAAWLALALGSARVAGLAAWLVAFHPWHVRYSTEARGYGLLLLLVPLMLVGFVYALRTGRWRWWALFAVTQFLAAASFVGVLYFSAVLNAAAALWLIWAWWKWRKKSAPELAPGSQHEGGETFFPGRLLARLTVANTLSGMLFLALMLPHIPQIREALSGAVAHQATGDSWRWWPDVLAYLGLGMPWLDAASDSEVNPAVMRIFGGEDGRTILGAVLAAATLFVLGAINLWRRDTAGRCLVVALAVTPVFYFLVTVLGGNALYRWHLVFFVPAVTAVIACGVSGKLGDRFKLTSGNVLRIVLVMMLFGGYSNPLDRYIRNPKENPKAIVVAARGGVYPHYLNEEKQVVFAAFNCVGVYDPLVAITPTVPLILEQIAVAERENRELYVQFARRPLVSPDVLELLESSGRFELVDRVPGLEESQYTNYLFRYLSPNSGEKSGE